MRQYGEIPPWLAPDNTPAVVSTSGLGTGGGAAVQTPDSGGFGEVLVITGMSSSATWNVVLAFPSTPPTLFISGDDAFGPISQSTTDNQVTLSGTEANFLPNGKPYKLHYEWNVSQ